MKYALMENGVVKDPYYENNCKDLLWIEDMDWWFFKDFEISEEILENRCILVFESIAYRAEIWVNGIQAGRMEGMFRRWYWDITDLLVKGTNRVALRMRAHEMSSRDLPGSLGTARVMPTGVVAPFTYQWNWSPHLVPIGIWKPVYIKVIGKACIKDPFVRTTIHWDNKGIAEWADVDVSLDVHSMSKQSCDLQVKGVITGMNFSMEEIQFRKNFKIQPGAADNAEIQILIEKPELWWPNGMGEHSIYNISFALLDEACVIQDETDTEFAVRQIEKEINPPG